MKKICTKSPFLLLGLLAVLLPSRAKAITINWNSDVLSFFLEQDGVTDLAADGDFTFDLGTFGLDSQGQVFVPTAANYSEWSTKFRSFDKATAANGKFEPGTYTEPGHVYDGGYFGSSIDLTSNTASTELGRQAYLWVYNTKALSPTTQWALLTGNDWTIPVAPGSQQTPPLDWVVQNGGLATYNIVWGGVDSVQGTDPGVYTNPTEPFTIQLHALPSMPVPEPMSFALLAAGVALILRRRRSA